MLHAVLIGMLLFFQSRAFIKERERFITVSIYEDKEISVPSLAINRGVENASGSEVVETPGNSRLTPKGISKDLLIEERIHAIKAKKRIEKLARLRAEIRETGLRDKEAEDQISRISIEAHSESGPVNELHYGDIVRATIKRNWHYPELVKEGLSATVVIHVRKDGAIKIIDFKTSGERLFDYSVKNALLKSSPFPPPPRECEIELRFSI